MYFDVQPHPSGLGAFILAIFVMWMTRFVSAGSILGAAAAILSHLARMFPAGTPQFIEWLGTWALLLVSWLTLDHAGRTWLASRLPAPAASARARRRPLRPRASPRPMPMSGTPPPTGWTRCGG